MFGRSKLETKTRVLQREALDDLVPRLGIRGGGQRDARHLRVALVQQRKLQVFGAEVVAPLRHTVGFVDCEQRHALRGADPVEQREEALGDQPLGRHIQEIERAFEQRTLGFTHTAGVQRGVQHGRAHTELAQRRDLVLHQCDQGRDDDGRAAPLLAAQQGRQLVAQRLPATRGHEHQRIAAPGEVADDLGLGAAEGGVAEDLAQQRERCVDGRCGRGRRRAERGADGWGEEIVDHRPTG